MRTHLLPLGAALVALFLVLGAPSARAHSQAAISGTVVDAAGQPLPRRDRPRRPRALGHALPRGHARRRRLRPARPPRRRAVHDLGELRRLRDADADQRLARARAGADDQLHARRGRRVARAGRGDRHVRRRPLAGPHRRRDNVGEEDIEALPTDLTLARGLRAPLAADDRLQQRLVRRRPQQPVQQRPGGRRDAQRRLRPRRLRHAGRAGRHAARLARRRRAVQRRGGAVRRPLRQLYGRPHQRRHALGHQHLPRLAARAHAQPGLRRQPHHPDDGPTRRPTRRSRTTSTSARSAGRSCATSCSSSSRASTRRATSRTRPASSAPARPTSSRPTSETVAQFISIAQNTYGYDPGTADLISNGRTSGKLLAKLDWNISPRHRFSLRNNYVRAGDDQGNSRSSEHLRPLEPLLRLPEHAELDGGAALLDLRLRGDTNEARLVYTGDP